MIKHIRIRNFKSLHDVSVGLDPFTVLVGRNGAGKTSFLQALQMLGWLVRHRSINDALESHNLGYNELVYLRSGDSKIQWDVEMSIPDPHDPEHHLDIQVSMGLAKRRHVYVTGEVVVRAGVNFFTSSFEEDGFYVLRKGRQTLASEADNGISYTNVTLPHSILLDVREQRDKFPVLGAVAEELAGILHYEIWGPERLRESSTGASAILSEHGQNLPSVLWALRQKHPQGFKNLVRELQQAYRWLDSIEFRHLAQGEYGLSFLEKAPGKKKRRIRYQPSQVSDGFLRLLALTALKYQPGEVSLVGYEEPENGMHPGMLQESVVRLRDVAQRGTQVIVTTHSPFLLQDLLSEDVGGNAATELRLVWRDQAGRTQIHPARKETLEEARSQGIGIAELWGMLLDEEKMA